GRAIKSNGGPNARNNGIETCQALAFIQDMRVALLHYKVAAQMVEHYGLVPPLLCCLHQAFGRVQLWVAGENGYFHKRFFFCLMLVFLATFLRETSTMNRPCSNV